MTTLTLRLKRPELPGGMELVAVEFNGDIETVEDQGEARDSYTYLWRLPWEQRMDVLRERLRGRDGE